MGIPINTLVVVLPYQNLVKKPCFGIVEEMFPRSRFLKVIIGKKDEDIVVLPEEKVIPLFRVEDSPKNPRRVVKKNSYQILAWVIQKLTEKTKEMPPISVQKNTLVVVRPSWDRPSPRLGLVSRVLKDKYDIRIGVRGKIFVPHDQIIPVIQTSGSLRGPEAAARKNLDNILLQIILYFFAHEKREVLDWLQEALESLRA